ncbi:MAG TPA: nitrous oxide-stimulated promoter family protein [Alloprevotella sp.]|nr:nitrous oxide-stimulated promoter family protein [Alloprevotella sp.]
MTDRIEEEKKIVRQMITLYCRRREKNVSLCPACAALFRYACGRLERCPHRHTDKPTCRKCPTHCYRPEMKEKIRVVMRWAGPRMLLIHPLAALRHFKRELCR